MKVRNAVGPVAACTLALWVTGILPAIATAAPAAGSGASETYMVVYKQSAVPADAAASVLNAGGTLLASASDQMIVAVDEAN